MAGFRAVSNIESLSALVVDDDTDMAQLIMALLRDMGVRNVDRAKDGMHAIVKLRQDPHRYNLVISDWEMPGVNGLQLLRAVRKQLPALPFLMLTVRKNSEEILAAKDARVTGYITKPFNPRDLQKKILAVITHTVPEEDVFTIC